MKQTGKRISIGKTYEKALDYATINVMKMSVETKRR
jgi:hypothetical protein